MGGKPRNFGAREHRPSPLKQEVSQRPISTLPPQSPGLGLVRDPQFWKRFSTAVHMSEENLKELEAGLAGTGGRNERSDTIGSGNGNWLEQQYREKRRCRAICMGVTLIVAILVAAAVVIVLHFTGRIKF
ncbi:hypothetical protein CJF32_00000190 [Rutstroemia sp. NJR-2017a WRK4]|nr:hypothetical protein CJF32_00000190 [Rutstroemia sp. NJR-2017a WRK4]